MADQEFDKRTHIAAHLTAAGINDERAARIQSGRESDIPPAMTTRVNARGEIAGTSPNPFKNRRA